MKLLCLISKEPIELDLSMKGTGSKKEEVIKKPTGLGIGSYDYLGKPIVYKYPIQVSESMPSTRISSRIYFFHICLLSEEALSLCNIQPFQYKNYLFVHVGDIRPVEKMDEMINPILRRNLKGSTDSERFFLILMNEIESHGDVLDGIRSALKLVKGSLSYFSLNFILSDGRFVFAYREGYPMYFRKIGKGEYIVRSLNYEGLSLRTMPREGIFKSPSVIFSSDAFEPIDGWIPMVNGELVIVNEKANTSSVASL
ncbi:MAG: class II glutamine amidotransferase [Candidatus Odinarchaeota archaeon]|nr:class II glutamine amidotransferase [Candidatus Odinarchaeota archaeon]